MHRTFMLPVLGLLALTIYFGFNADNFLTSGNLLNIARDGSVLLIVAIGATWVILMGSIDLSVGSVVTLAGLTSALAVESVPPAVAVLVGVLIGLGAGALNGLLFAYARVPSFLVTLGMSLALAGAGLWIVGGRPVQIFSLEFLSLSTGTLVGTLPNIALWSFLIYLLAIVVSFRTRFGRFAYAIGGGEAVAQLSGVAVRRYKFYAMTVSGALAGLAGVLLSARVGAATPAMGSSLILESIAAVVMGGTALTGGIGGVHRTIVGVLFITVLANGLDVMGVNPYLQSIIQGVVVIGAVALTIDRAKLAVLK
jgi:ribose transport system permease protein/putative xylitol transport system permease protein